MTTTSTKMVLQWKTGNKAPSNIISRSQVAPRVTPQTDPPAPIPRDVFADTRAVMSTLGWRSIVIVLLFAIVAELMATVALLVINAGVYDCDADRVSHLPLFLVEWFRGVAKAVGVAVPVGFFSRVLAAGTESALQQQLFGAPLVTYTQLFASNVAAQGVVSQASFSANGPGTGVSNCTVYVTLADGSQVVVPTSYGATVGAYVVPVAGVACPVGDWTNKSIVSACDAASVPPNGGTLSVYLAPVTGACTLGAVSNVSNTLLLRPLVMSPAAPVHWPGTNLPTIVFQNGGLGTAGWATSPPFLQRVRVVASGTSGTTATTGSISIYGSATLTAAAVAENKAVLLLLYGDETPASATALAQVATVLYMLHERGVPSANRFFAAVVTGGRGAVEVVRSDSNAAALFAAFYAVVEVFETGGVGSQPTITSPVPLTVGQLNIIATEALRSPLPLLVQEDRLPSQTSPLALGITHRRWFGYTGRVQVPNGTPVATPTTFTNANNPSIADVEYGVSGLYGLALAAALVAA